MGGAVLCAKGPGWQSQQDTRFWELFWSLHSGSGTSLPCSSCTCSKDNVWLESSKLRTRHHVPVQLRHCHTGLLGVVGAGADQVSLWYKAVEHDIGLELLEDAVVAIAEDEGTGLAALADGKAGEAGSTAQLQHRPRERGTGLEDLVGLTSHLTSWGPLSVPASHLCAKVSGFCRAHSAR